MSPDVFSKQPKWFQDGMNHIQEWIKLARKNQLPPKGEWTKWFLCGGRRAGKTRTGAETLFYLAFTQPNTRWAVIAPTNSDLKKVVFGGESGLLSVIPQSCYEGDNQENGYNKSDHVITLKNKSVIMGFSAETPSRIRGHGFNGGWADELAAWNDGRELQRDEDGDWADPSVYTWDMFMFALSLGENPKVIITSTPKSTELIRKLYYDPDVNVVTSTTYENRKNLGENYFKEIQKYEGTAKGRQEIYAELLESMDGGIFKRDDFVLWAAKNPLPAFDFVIQSYDTAFTEKTINDRTACTTWGMFVHPKRGSCAMLLDCWADRLGYPDLKERAVEEFESCVFGEFDRGVDLILIEAKGSGISLQQDLQREELPVMAYNPGSKSKFERASLVSYLPVHGKIFIPEGKDENGKGTQKPTAWANEMLTELSQFTGKQRSHDDYVDSFSQAAKYLLEQGFFAGEHKEVDDDFESEYNQPIENPYAA